MERFLRIIRLFRLLLWTIVFLLVLPPEIDNFLNGFFDYRFVVEPSVSQERLGSILYLRFVNIECVQDQRDLLYTLFTDDALGYFRLRWFIRRC